MDDQQNEPGELLNVTTHWWYRYKDTYGDDVTLKLDFYAVLSLLSQFYHCYIALWCSILGQFYLIHGDRLNWTNWQSIFSYNLHPYSWHFWLIVINSPGRRHPMVLSMPFDWLLIHNADQLIVESLPLLCLQSLIDIPRMTNNGYYDANVFPKISHRE